MPIIPPCHILRAMWQVFSSEKPARPRLALFVIALTLGASLGVAWLICLGTSVELADVDQRPEYWPVRFQLPNHVKWVFSGSDVQLSAQNEGETGKIAFLGIAPGHGLCQLTIGYETNTTVPADSAAVMGGSHLTEIDSIDIGPLVGRLYIRETMEDLIWLARARTDDGMMLEVEIASPYYSPDTDKLLREVCRSIRYQDWWLPKPELWPERGSMDDSEVTS